MNWIDLTQNWRDSYDALSDAFPNLEQSAMPFLKGDQDRFESYLAATHDMTLEEARKAMDRFLEENQRILHTA